MKRRRLHHDFETYCGVSLPDVGASRYARHPSCEILMCAYAFDDGEIKQWVPEEGQPIPAELEDALLDPAVVKFAWNKGFEWAVWRHVHGVEIPHAQWRDPMVLAHSLALPGKLEKAGEIVGLDVEQLKDPRGKTLMRTFSQPRKPTKTKPWTRTRWYHEPEKWEQYLAYNRRDVESERAIWHRTRAFDMPAHEWQLWVIDQEINERGIPVSLEMIANAQRLIADVTQSRLARMVALTGLENPNSPKQLLPWLQARGYPFDDLKKGHVKRAAEQAKETIEALKDIPGETDDHRERLEVLDLRLEVSRTSVKKFGALESHTDDDGRLRNTLQFAGAGRTWRWAGRVYQAQNLAKPVKELDALDTELVDGVYVVTGGTQIEVARHLTHLDAEAVEWLYDKPMDAISMGVRPVIQAGDGKLLLDADLNAIENRVLGWLADDRKILKVFEDDLDPYLAFAVYMLQRSYEALLEEYKAGDKKPRTDAKPGVLGCGYMLSAGKEYEDEKTGEMEATGLLGYAKSLGIKLTPAQAEHSVNVWRSTYTGAVQFWDDIYQAAWECIRTGQEQSCRHIGFDLRAPFLRMILPSGRALHYCRPKIKDWKTPWGKTKLQITYEGLNDRKQWVRQSTHPGKLTENADQAVARDLLAHGIRLARREGLDVVMHVHDQIIAEVDERGAPEKLKTLIDCMSERPSWAPGLPMAAAGVVSKWFVKD